MTEVIAFKLDAQRAAGFTTVVGNGSLPNCFGALGTEAVFGSELARSL